MTFPHHRSWVDLFLGWWEEGFLMWRSRNKDKAELVFTCELGPKPYAISGKDGNDSTDRWSEALQLKDMIHKLWASTAPR